MTTMQAAVCDSAFYCAGNSIYRTKYHLGPFYQSDEKRKCTKSTFHSAVQKLQASF